MFGILGIQSNHLFYFIFDRLECLPYTFRKLTNLKALWLSENQVMIQLTTDSCFSALVGPLDLSMTTKSSLIMIFQI